MKATRDHLPQREEPDKKQKIERSRLLSDLKSVDGDSDPSHINDIEEE